MDCDRCRDTLSALMDDHPLPPAEVAAATAHRGGCTACAAWEERSIALVRRLRVATVEPVPDRTMAILEAADRRELLPRPRHVARTILATRIGLVLLGTAQVLLAVSAFTMTDTHHIHLAREHASFELALAIGLFSVARRPALAGGLLPFTAVLAASLLLTGGLDIAAGNTVLSTESLHLLAAGGVGLLWWLRRGTEDIPTPAIAPLAA